MAIPTQMRSIPVVDAGPWPREVAEGLAYLRTGIVNVYFVGSPGAGDRGWTLVDAGMPGSAAAIAGAAARRFGPEARPNGIVLTHGHFDHVGAVRSLARMWNAPVFAHEMELPYLTGRSPYPPPDPTVGGGLLSGLSWTFPRGPIDLGSNVRALPGDHSVPGMSGWKWVETPGHSPGHASFYRESDVALIAGDAFVTTRQESLTSAMAQTPEMNGPPAYFTQDWAAAAESVRRLAALSPSVAATGHGPPMEGEAMRTALRILARDFERQAVPDHGRYVGNAATFDVNGVASVPPDVPHPVAVALTAAAGVAAGVALLATIARARGRRDGGA